MSSGASSLFGSLPDRPPSPSDEPRPNRKSHKKKQNSKTKSTKIKSNRVSSAKQPSRGQRGSDDKEHRSLARTSSQVGNESKIPQRYEFQNNRAFKTLDTDFVANIEKFKRQLINSQIDARHQQRLLQKSRKVGLQNKRKRQIAMKMKQNSMKQDQLNLQKAIFYQISNQKHLELNSISSKLFIDQKQKALDQKRRFKAQITLTNNVANQRLIAAQIKFDNKAEELRDTLKQMQMIKRVNEIDQKKVLRDLDRQIQQEQSRVNEGLVQELYNQKERTSLIRDKGR